MREHLSPQSARKRPAQHPAFGPVGDPAHGEFDFRSVPWLTCRAPHRQCAR
jgi:hypothetical protein